MIELIEVHIHLECIPRPTSLLRLVLTSDFAVEFSDLVAMKRPVCMAIFAHALVSVYSSAEFLTKGFSSQ